MPFSKLSASNSERTLGYLPISKDPEFDHDEHEDLQPSTKSQTWRPCLRDVSLAIVSAILGFALCALSNNVMSQHRQNVLAPTGIEWPDEGLEQPRVNIGFVPRAFEHDTEFTLPPPSSTGFDNESEPIWDSLIPRGLGYVSHPSIPISIPTVFHQLHCLYTIRRAYYHLLSHGHSPSTTTTAAAGDTTDLQRWDFNKSRPVHVAHCFDFLQQGLTCAADSTLEPAVNGPDHDFLGTGFTRQCRDFEALKQFTEEHRVFEAEGFLAEGWQRPG